MAFFDDGYTWHQQHNTYAPADYQDSVSFSDYEPYGLIVSKYQEPTGDYDYDYNYNYDYDYGCGYPDINYFAYNYEEPKLITYSVSYSKIDSGFNEPEFEEYDPTPYGGGYDIISVYGKPLPPSDRTCYPHSNQKHIPSVETKLRPENESGSGPKPQDMHVPVVMPQPVPVPTPEGPDLGEKKRDEYIYPDHGYDYPWPEYENGNRIGVGYDYGYGKQVVQIPPVEYDPYVVDLCENLFGNWPCLARIRNQQMSIDNKPGITCPEIGHRNPMEECASYIFGRPVHGYVD